MDPELLTEKGWKPTAVKFKIKDNGLLRALSVYEKLDEDKYENRLKAIGSVSQLAGALNQSHPVSDIPVVVDYLADLLSAAETERREITKAELLAEKTHAMAAQAKAMADKKAEAESKKQEQEEEDEKEAADDYRARLLAAFQKLKSTKDLSFEFIVCDAKPHCGLMVAKRITPKHKAELTELTGGSRRFLHPGTCQFEDGHFAFRMEQPVTGLARKLQDSIKNFTGKKLPIVVGVESADEGDE